MVDEARESEQEGQGEDEEGETEAATKLQLSLHALWGLEGGKIMRIRGVCQKKPLRILIDTGSTHNFLSSQVASKVKCDLIQVLPAAVEVANGQLLQCLQMCKNFQWEMQGAEFSTRVHIIPLDTYDLILGAQWLSTLGDISWNFNTLKMSFKLNGVQHQLEGEKWGWKKTELSCLKLISQQDTLEGQGAVSDIKISEVMTAVEGTTFGCFNIQQEEIWPELGELLHSFADIFAEPKGLPPMRSHDHRIVLKEDSQPINIRPYKYAAQQKDAIENMIKEMLETGVIRHSRSSYASPIVLVKKKDGAWRMCVDYRSLNASTVKDKYPIPVIEELLDELGTAGWFQKST